MSLCLGANLLPDTSVRHAHRKSPKFDDLENGVYRSRFFRSIDAAPDPAVKAAPRALTRRGRPKTNTSTSPQRSPNCAISATPRDRVWVEL